MKRKSGKSFLLGFRIRRCTGLGLFLSVVRIPDVSHFEHTSYRFFVAKGLKAQVTAARDESEFLTLFPVIS